MNRINQKLKEGKKILSIYFTAGYPKINDTVKIIEDLEKNGVDLIEIGLPFSDPLELLFEQLKDIRKSVSIPLIIMGYFNPVFQYGVEAFCKRCQEIGIDGLILPDLPLDVYLQDYEATFKKYGLINVFLITPSVKRIKEIDAASTGFIYMVSSASTTGATTGFGHEQQAYFERIAALNLKNPQIVGFGINNAETFDQATRTTAGAIIGSAFIKHLNRFGIDSIQDFIKTIR